MTSLAGSLTTPAAKAAPALADFHARDVAFGLDSGRVKDWAANEWRTLFLNTLSMTFPVGERFFINSVAKFRDRVSDPKLRAEVGAFVSQEALHTREHIEYNRAISTIVDVAPLEQDLAAFLAGVKRIFGPRICLAVTCALEHFTAIMAKDMLEYAPHLQGAERQYARLWTWHALEECEHKAVSFDVYQTVTNGRGAWRRIVVMVPTTVLFYAFVGKFAYALMKAQGHAKSPLAWAKLLWAVFGRDGMMRRIAPAYFRYYSPNFHPGDIDDSATRGRAKQLVESWAS
jgi:predicted metal-dependent hydrolase